MREVVYVPFHFIARFNQNNMFTHNILSSAVVALVLLLPLMTYGFRQQMVGVRGRLLCGTNPLNNTKVKLWNKNHLGTDDQLADVQTDNYGNYEISGGVGELLAMNVHLKPCQRKVNLGVPDQYVTRSSKVEKWFEAGSMNMEFKFPDEERSCIN